MLKENDSKYILQTVKNAGRILNLFTIERSTWRLSEISNELDLDISHVRRLLTTMVQENILKKVGKTYSLGFSVLHLAGIVNSQLNIHLEARSILMPLVEQLGVAIHIGILEGTGVIYLDKLETSHPIKMVSQVGKSHPVYSTGCGKTMLAFQTEDDLEEILQKVEQQGMIKSASRTVTDLDELKRQLGEIRKAGYAITCDEFQEGFASIAAPIYNYNGEAIAAVSITGSSKNICGNRIDIYISSIVKAAKEISKKIGFSYY
ncbi:IclR family transcriptional regulator [Niallia endozanthoxylica]|uniref:IclR family transcriptional regulator n=1 Tax=Niallia endozanthoxylica TaxID=2036016 RepID=A0A5J5I1N8_9BACI|nr:IclR family transcriptional regulator [Niallia endozanthoxylica]KAA9028460.1 IclR family transcriptional regulator [Niallia endozanthoxylica]